MEWIVIIAAALAGLRAMNALRNVGFTITAANLSRAAALLSAAGGVINGMATAITNLARMVVANARISVNSSALDNIKSIWDSIPKNASVTLAAPSLNLAIVAMMGVNSTVAALVSNAASPAAFAPRLDAGLFFGVMAIVTVAWAAVRAISLAPVIFTAAAIPGNVLLVAAQITALWARARALATLPALFSASATPGNVAAVANQIVAAWARVRAASAVRPRFIAAGRASGRGASSIVAAWMRVVGMPRAWAATGIVSPGNVPGASASMVSAWMALYGMGRRWHGVATCNFSGASVSIPHGGSVTVGGSSGGDWYDPTNLFVTNPATPFTGRPYNPFVGIPGGGLGGGTTPPAGIGGNIGGINPQDYLDGGSIAPPNPGDFSGGFEEFSKGSGTKRRKVGTFGVGGSKDRHIHIEHDIFVRNEAEFNDLMDQILGG